MRQYAQNYHTALAELRAMGLFDFIRDFGEAAEESKQQRKEIDKQVAAKQRAAKAKAPHAPHVRRRR